MALNVSQGRPPKLYDELKADLARLDERSLRRSIVTPETGAEPHVALDGCPYTLFTSNNYLGLSTDPRVIEAAVEATRRYGASVSASRLLCGSTPLHQELEQRLAALKGQEACLLFSSGYLANLGVIAALTGPDDAVFSDHLNHASIIDGCRLSRAATVVYGHCDLDGLEAALRRTPARRRLIVSESVFSMDGDVAPAPGLLRLAERHGALLVLDEAHSTGALGKDGAGVLSHFGIGAAPVVIVGTLSKALGSLGGFVAGDASVIAYLQNRSRTFIFDTALPAGPVAAALAALEVMKDEPWRQERLHALAGRLRRGFARLGFPATRSATQIVPLLLGQAQAAVAMEARLRAAGVLARAIRPPTVPEGTSRIRFNVMATHQDADIQRVLDAVAAV